MPSLKDLKVRISSVKSTQKITSAMKMVAASKLRRAQEQAEAARPYAERMERMLGTLASNMVPGSVSSPLLAGTGSNQKHLIVVMTSDRGLCGGFNATIARETRRMIRELQADGREVALLCVGRKGRDSLRRDHRNIIIGTIEDIGRPRLGFADADGIAKRLLAMLERDEFDVCTLVYNKFQSALTQIVTRQQLIPFKLEEADGEAEAGAAEPKAGPNALYEFEPDEEQILDALLPRNIGVQIFRALLENAASEQGARMTAMDNATRNAGEMIDKLTLEYNRSRQAAITKELIEIISGAEAL